MGLPVVPISMKGLFEAMPSGRAYVNLGSRVTLHIGKPIDISQFNDINEAMAAVREKVAEGLES
jgi:1-acyl-sn-glycerol-3-phosphate acyltransferase